jgi:hypothetical protein
MHFEAEHHFPGSCARVVAVLGDPDFHTQLDLPDLSRPEVVASTADGTLRSLRLRYRYIGHLDPVARKILSGRSLSWVQELRIDSATGEGSLSFEAEADAGRLNGNAIVRLTATNGATHVRRHIAGEFHVRVPLVGGTAERRIVPGLVRRLDVEAAALSAELASRSRSE